MSISITTYFLILFVIQTVPLSYVFIFGYSYFPRAPYLFLEDASVAEILGINITGGQTYALVAFSPPVNVSTCIIRKYYSRPTCAKIATHKISYIDILKLVVGCMDGIHAAPPTLSPFKWERWLKPFSAEVV